MLNWNISKHDFKLVCEIADRAQQTAEAQGFEYPYRQALMDVQATHANGCPLDLKGLLWASPHDFTHDLGGIRNHLNRQTGKLEDCFTPRYAKGVRA